MHIRRVAELITVCQNLIILELFLVHFVSNFLFDFVDLNLMRYNLAQEREEMIHFVYLHLVICINYVFEVDFSRI